MRKLTLAVVLLYLTISTTLTACSGPNQQIEDPWGTITLSQRDSIRIAVATALNEELVGIEGLEQLRGVELAVEQYGDIKGFPIELVSFDSGCSTGRGPAAATDLTRNRNTVAVIGHTCSHSCELAAPIYETARFTAISPSCAATSLTDEIVHVEAFMRTMYDDAVEGRTAAEFAYIELGARRAAVFYDGTLETSDLIEAFSASFENQGGLITSTILVDPGEDTFRPLLGDLTQNRPDVIYAPLLAVSGSRLVLQMRATGLAGVPLLGGRHFLSTWFIQEAGLETAGRVFAAGPALSSDLYQEVVVSYEDLYGVPPASDSFAYAYDATVILLEVIEQVSVRVDRQQLQIGRQALREALYETARHEGATGTLTCTNWGDCSQNAVGVSRIFNNQWQTVYKP